MAEQLVFDLPQRSAQGREDFFVSPANAVAVAQIDDWQNWPQRKLALVGPPGAGKTHLAHVWATQTGAQILAASDLGDLDIAHIASLPAVVVEDADRIPDTAQDQLFHLHNLILAEGGSLLLTARTPPSRWPLTLPDLQSRMQGTAVATLDAPDDALLTALLVKLFADRQLALPPRLLPYLLPRMERSFAAAQHIVTQLDRRALATGRKISERLAAEILDASDD